MTIRSSLSKRAKSPTRAPQRSAIEQSRAEQSRAEQSKAKQSKAKQSKAKQSKAKQSTPFPSYHSSLLSGILSNKNREFCRTLMPRLKPEMVRFCWLDVDLHA